MATTEGVFPAKLKRDVRVASPRPVFRALQDLLEEQGFRVEREEPLTTQAAAIPGTGEFHGKLVGVKDIPVGRTQRRTGKVMLGAGALLTVVLLALMVTDVATDRFVVSLVLFVAVMLGGMGLGRLREPEKSVRHLVEVEVEGESYQAGAAQAAGSDASGLDVRVERTGVVSDMRITVAAGVGEPDGPAGVRGWLPGDQQVALNLDVEPSLTLPAPRLTAAAVLPDRRFDYRLESIASQWALPEPGQQALRSGEE